jgi:hypothetical protein
MALDRRRFLKSAGIGALSLYVHGCLKSTKKSEDLSGKKPNILLICVDDLRPELGCYGKVHMKTPHLDRLAKQGCLFSHHYIQAPTCGPSRYSLLTGLRPHHVDQLNNTYMENNFHKRPETGDIYPPLPAEWLLHGGDRKNQSHSCWPGQRRRATLGTALQLGRDAV